ncbi:MAG: hypothetical protein ACQESC_02970 [Nanobdellota archaeon]
MTFNEILVDILNNIGLIGKSLVSDSSLLWQLLPIFLVWFTLEIYFGLYMHESLGWNTALANGISLFWIVLSSLQYIFSQEIFSWLSFIIVLFLGLYAFFIVITTFKHSLSKKVEFHIAAATPIYYFSTIVLLVAYQKITLNGMMIVSILILFALVAGFFWIFRVLLPAKDKDKDKAEETGFDDKTEDGGESDLSSDALSSDDNSSFSQDDSFSESGLGDGSAEFSSDSTSESDTFSEKTNYSSKQGFSNEKINNNSGF